MVTAQNKRTRPVKHSASADTGLYSKDTQIWIHKPNAAHKISNVTLNLINDYREMHLMQDRMFKIGDSVVFNTLHSMHYDYNYLYVPTNVHKMYKITSYLQTQTLLHVSAVFAIVRETTIQWNLYKYDTNKSKFICRILKM
jgi:hypothetical protein